MTKAVAPKTRAQLRKEEARQRARRRQHQRLLARLGGLGAVVLLLGFGIWWVALRDDAGATGEQALYQFSTDDFHALAFDPVDADTVYFGHHGGLQVSRDGGGSWNDTNLTGVDAMQLAMPASDSQRLYAAGHGVFYVSSDGGMTWREQPNNLPGLDLHTFAGSPSDPMRLYAAPAGQGLFTSSDGGATWEVAAMPPGEMGMTALVVSPDDPLHLYAGGGNDTLLESTDGARTWQALPGPPGTVMAVAAALDGQATLYAATAQGFFKQARGGGWERQSIEPDGVILAIAVSPVEPSRIAALDQSGNFYRSDDGGQSWETE